ncbi:Putative LuxR-family transcriptional regulator [Streptomyces venezuelae]|uniref:helix-turn-helix transcriptional regulator n=1 Tax=Streptomyces gardneri TaxID=66892 RepID=UPI0006BD90EB|nr:helix-turn-helix transcriptional regulator [Streptomyces gardneri]ALO11840.1 Putative LuxR-family transcriptional regulator [Streptomyces venezuelae]QPK48701.1 helix-turn-helix transcriptional regulator [Streptomyces gardneri]WRK40178.1 helix-turn-helix transcriptional regulator [Streptomyces venezuelae]CUM37604.1 putative LuxR-family transcriptional regulator [Streptomyces venezuelae]
MREHVESVELRGALLRLRRATGLPVVFGGLLQDGRALRIAELSGAVTPALRGLAISAGSGLGGKCLALSRPCAVTDYPSARHITHEYDVPVSAEGLRSVIAVPVVVRRKVRGVLYGALRDALPIGERVFDAAVAAARDVEQALAVRDEAQRLLAPPPSAPSWEEVRQAYGELRALAPRVADAELRERLLAVCGRLESASGAGAAPASGQPVPAVSLTPRETDVLAAVASGATNAVAAERLGLRPETVKGYLRSAMRKLGAHTRLEAVVAARRAGVLP